MACTMTKITQTAWQCIGGVWHTASERLWNCQQNLNGITYDWTEWRLATEWSNTGILCTQGPSSAVLPDTQTAVVDTGAGPQPVQQRLHQLTVAIQGVGPQSWLVWV